MANVRLKANTKNSAPALITSDVNWDTLVWWAGLASGLKNSM